jgi:hypothetical protein
LTGGRVGVSPAQIPEILAAFVFFCGIVEQKAAKWTKIFAPFAF